MESGTNYKQGLGRKVREVGGHYELREQGAAYNAHFAPKKVLLSTENTYCLDLNVELSNR
jgi:hypothetical protein